MNGFVKLHRQLIEWEWYEDINCRLTFIHCLLVANFKPKKWRGYDIKRGQFIGSLGKLSESIGISKQQLRTVLDKFEKTGEMTSEGQGNNTLYTVLNYDDYQDIKQDNQNPATHRQHRSNTPPTQEQHTVNTGVTTTKEGKKEKKEEEREEEERVKSAPTKEEISLLQFKKLQAENERLNLELKNKSEAQKEEPKSSAKKVKAKHEFPSNEPQKAYKANSNNFPSMSEFEEMPIHEDQIKKKYQLELSKFTYPSSWTEYLINQFLEWCAGKDEKLLGKFGSTQVKALIRKINGYLKDYDAKTIGDSIELSLSTPYNNFNPKWIIDRQEKESAAKAEKQSDDGTPSYMLGLKTE
jgi:hypothetical protein